MRELVIDRIQSSRCYRSLYDNGEDTPILNLMPNDDLLEYLIFCLNH